MSHDATGATGGTVLMTLTYDMTSYFMYYICYLQKYNVFYYMVMGVLP